MGIPGNRIYRGRRPAGRVRALIRDRAGNTACPDSSGAFFILIYWSRIYAIGRIGESILTRLRPASSRASAFVLGLFVYYILAITPVVGWLVVTLVILFGLGAELIARKKFYVSARSQDLI
jgi:hypothetical protein